MEFKRQEEEREIQKVIMVAIEAMEKDLKRFIERTVDVWGDEFLKHEIHPANALSLLCSIMTKAVIEMCSPLSALDEKAPEILLSEIKTVLLEMEKEIKNAEQKTCH